MKFNADFFYCIGSSHHFCEDFANASVSEDGTKAFAIVSDGCSSAKDSQIGSMLLTKSAEQHLYPIRDSIEMVNLAMQGANVFRRTIGVSLEALRATLLTVLVGEEAFCVTATGDGVIVARNKNTHEITIVEIIYESGAPFYPIYALTQADCDQYLTQFPGNYTVRFYTNGIMTQEITIPVNQENGMKPYAWDFSFEKYDLVGVISDGAQSFYKNINVPIPMVEIVNEMFAFKNTQPNFVKRRMQKAFKAFDKLGYNHHDDFSIGVVACDE